MVGEVWDDEPDSEPASAAPRAKVVVVLVVSAVMLATLVLCCVAVGETARLIDVDPAHLW
jgi:hypothetical protein